MCRCVEVCKYSNYYSPAADATKLMSNFFDNSNMAVLEPTLF